MTGLAIGGLQPLVGSIQVDPEATAEQRLGDPADPRHGQGLIANPVRYPWEVLAGVANPGPAGQEAQLIGQSEGWAAPHGTGDGDPMFDATPDTHAAPWPKGVEQSVDPDAVARQLAQSARIHASNTGGSRRLIYRPSPRQSDWTGFYDVDPGSSKQDPAIPGQIKTAVAGGGSTDRAAWPNRQNSYGFDSAHKMRRWARASIPGNYLWMRPGARPLVKSQPGPARPAIGENSPFTGQDLAAAHGLQGAVLYDPPVEYTAPPEPYVAPDYGPAPEPAAVAWW